MKERSLQDQVVIEAFAERLRELREGHPYQRITGRTPALMPKGVAARRAGLDGSYWGRLERGLSDPTLTSLLRIQQALGLDSIETLLGPTASKRLAADLSDPHES